MACTNCNKQDDCFEVVTSKCDEGCKDIVLTDCIFHNTNGDAKLFNLGITTGTQLKYILLALDKKLENTLISNFSGFNMHGLNLETEILTLQEFVEAVTLQTKELKDDIVELDAETASINLNLDDLTELVGSIININVSNTELNINSTDEIRVVINKILSYLDDFEIPDPIVFNDSETVEFSQSGNAVIADIKISQEIGNTLLKRDDGLYTAHLSISSILSKINADASLKSAFSALVLQSFPCFSFDIMATSNSPIKYVNCLGTEVTVTAKSNILLKLTDVKSIITSPSENIVITFKGI